MYQLWKPHLLLLAHANFRTTIQTGVKIPDGQFKFPHLWPVKLPHGGRPDYDESPVTAMRAAASLSR